MKNKRQSKNLFNIPIKKRTRVTDKSLNAAYNPKVTKFKFDEYPLPCRVHFLSFMDFLLKNLSPLKRTYMLRMEYPSIRGEDLIDYFLKATWNLLHGYICAHRRILRDKYPVYRVQSTTRLQSQCENFPFLTRAGTIHCFINWCTKYWIHKSTISRYFKMLSFGHFSGK